MGARDLHHEDMLIPRDVFITPQLFERRKEILVPRHSVTLLRPEDFAAMMPVADRDFESWLEALAIGDERAVAWLRVHVRRRRAATFSSYSDTYNSGSGTITGPSGVSAALLRSYGGGGGGAWRTNTSVGGGGGGGGYVEKTAASVAAGDHINYAVGAYGPRSASQGAAATAGTSSTANSGTGGFSGLSLTAGGGGGGNNGTGGTAGSASGGDTNTAGGAGSSTAGGGTGGNCNGAGGGFGGAGDDSGGFAGVGGTPGGGGGGASNISAPNDGGPGRFYVLWS